MKALNKIVAGFNKTVTQLEKLADANKKESDVRTIKVLALNEEMKELDAESKEALKVAANIKKLLGVTE